MSGASGVKDGTGIFIMRIFHDKDKKWIFPIPCCRAVLLLILVEKPRGSVPHRRNGGPHALRQEDAGTHVVYYHVALDDYNDKLICHNMPVDS
jgi:hypothetical protein